MDRARETRKTWSAIGELLFWVILYFWAVWFFNLMLPAVPEQTPVEVFMQKRLGDSGDSGERREGSIQDQSEMEVPTQAD